MKKKLIIEYLIVILIIFLFLMNFIIYSYYNKYNNVVNENKELKIKSDTLIKTFTNVGDFLIWQPQGASWTTFTDTGNELYLYMEWISGTRIALKPIVKECSTTIIKSTQWVVNYTAYNFDTTDIRQCGVMIRVNYSDGSSSTYWAHVFDISPKEWVYFSYIINKTYAENKYISNFTIYGYSSSTYNLLYIWLKEERYYGELPSVFLWINQLDYIQVGTNVIFTANISNVKNFESMDLSLNYMVTSQYTYMNMVKIWEFYNAYEINYEFRYLGGYLCVAILYLDFWEIYVTSNVKVIYITEFEFPASSYLSLFSNLDGFPLESKDFKIYLGEDEEFSLVNFRDYYGDWNRIYLSSNVSAQLQDDYIKFSAVNNGIKTKFQDLAIVNTYIYNVLLFEIRVENPLTLAIIYNPETMDKTYYLNFTETFKWFSVIIPFFNFTTYYATNYLYEIGFWINSGIIELANIRCAKYYTPIFYNQTNYYTEIYNRNEGIELEEHNYTIITGHYTALYSFTYDVIGGNPTGWSIVEDANTHVDIDDIQINHKMIVELWDNNGGAGMYPEFYQTFTSQVSGIFEFWIKGTKKDSNSYCYFWLKSGATTAITLVWNFWTGKIEHSGTSYGNLQDNVWTHIRIDFDCDIDKFDLYQDSVKIIDQKNFDTGTINIDTFYQITGSGCANNFYLWIDAIDYSWASGYCLGRNYNNSVEVQAWYKDIQRIIDFNYIEKGNLLERGIIAIYLNLSIISNQSNYLTQFFNYITLNYENIQSNNYTNYLIEENYYNVSQFRYRFIVNSTVNYNFVYNLSLNQSYYEIVNLSNYNSLDYRLISEENRQNPNKLIFDAPSETLVILDYFNTTLYRKEINYNEYIDIDLPIFTLTIANWENFTIVFSIERGLGVLIEIAIPSNMMVSLRIYSTLYRASIRNLQLELLNVTDISSEGLKFKVIEYGEKQVIEIPPVDFWGELWKFFFGTWYGILLFIIIVIVIIVNIYDAINNIKNWRKTRKIRKKEKIQRIYEDLRGVDIE